MPPPKLRRLQVFDAVARLGSVGRAAATLSLSQPAVTQALARLDDAFAARLLDRTRTGSFLTPAGRLLHRRVARLRDTIAGAIAAIGGPDAALSRVTDSQVAALVAIAESGSFAAAARRLGVAEPSLHRAARSLEAGVGVPLYRATPQGLAATPAGRLLAQRLRLALSELDRAREEIEAISGRIGGRVVVGALPLMPKRVLARAAGALLRSHPAVRIELIEAAHESLTADLHAGAIDIMVGALRDLPLAPHSDAELAQEPLFADPYVYVVRRGHPLLASHAVATRDLAAYDWIVPQAAMPRRAVIEELFRSLPQRPRVVVETSSVAMMIAILQESDCITLLSRAQVAAELAALTVDADAPHRDVGITTRVNWLPTPAQTAFLQFLRNAHPNGAGEETHRGAGQSMITEA